jgi:small subunit ribosomal protein S10
MSENIKLRLRSYNLKILNQTISGIINSVTKCWTHFSGPVFMPTKITRFTVNRASNIDKKSREQFEIRVYTRVIYIKSNTNVVKSLMKIESPVGVAIDIKVTSS